MCVFAQDKAVDAVVPCLLLAVRMHAAARDNGHVRVFAHIKVVVNQIVHRAVGHACGDIYGFAPGAGLDGDVDAGFIRFGSDLDVLGGLPPGAQPVQSETALSSRSVILFMNDALLPAGSRMLFPVRRAAAAGSHPGCPVRTPARLR